jgi:NAD(P)-dependent dehydrogenase (short-subunit alcohol dehydrogenase family)
MHQFKDKIVLVTGGNSGIGKAAAKAFAREGARVLIAARRADSGEEVVSEIRESGGEAFFIQTDVSKSEDLKNLFSKIENDHSRLDYAFNNAAIEGKIKPLIEFEESDFDEVIDTNLKSVWLCMKYQIQMMLGQTPSGGAIVNTSSVNGLGGVANGALYAAAKAGVNALTKSAALEFAQKNIRVNALVAGGFRTPMLERVMETTANNDPEIRNAVEQQINQMVPLGRIGEPEEAAETVLWLCSDKASYITGHSMIVDGGLTAWAR